MNHVKSFSSFSESSNSNQSLNNSLGIIYRDKYLAVVNKPAGMASQPGKRVGSDVITAIGSTLLIPADRIFLVNRLDQPVSGLMIVAFNAKTQSELNRQQLDRKIVKKYLAVTINEPQLERGKLINRLIRDGSCNMSKIVDKKENGSKLGVLNWQKMAVISTQINNNESISLALLEIILETGRHHQIRVQLSINDWNIFGDKKYSNVRTINEMKYLESKYRASGDCSVNSAGIALLSWNLEFYHPNNGKKLSFTLPYPEYFPFCLFSDISFLAGREKQK